MAELSHKRANPANGASHRDKPSKKPRLTSAVSSSAASTTNTASAATTEAPLYEVVNRPTAQDVGRDGLRRSIAIALEHVGFDAATPEALESFTEAAETCMLPFSAFSSLGLKPSSNPADQIV